MDEQHTDLRIVQYIEILRGPVDRETGFVDRRKGLRSMSNQLGTIIGHWCILVISKAEAGRCSYRFEILGEPL